jgi:tight adherence protein B
MGLLLAIVAGAGAYFLYTSLVLGQRGLRLTQADPTRGRRRRDWLIQAGLADVPVRDLAAVVVALALVGGMAAYAVFGGILPALATAAFAATFPLASYRVRRRARRAAAMDAWPRLLEELRILTSSLGRSIPQALFEVGRRAPEELRPAFAAAHRTWLLSTDFSRTLGVLKANLADPTADAVCETLLVAHEVGGTDLDRRLEALIDDRVQDTQGRKDARAKQAGTSLV